MKIIDYPLMENIQTLMKMLEEHHQAVLKEIPVYDSQPVSFAAYDKGVYLGGLTGKIVWNHLHIDMLAVTSNLRHSGVGTALMARAENLALSHDRQLIIIEMINWQAPGFYQKMGYSVFGEVKDIPVANSHKIYLVKYLPASL